MKIRRRLRFVALLLLAATGLAANTLDFPTATFRVRIGSQATTFTAQSGGATIPIDGKNAITGERRHSLMRVKWIIAPIEGVGDEYVFIVRRPNQKPRTLSAIFKGGYTQISDANDLLIEIEQDN